MGTTDAETGTGRHMEMSKKTGEKDDWDRMPQRSERTPVSENGREGDYLHSEVHESMRLRRVVRYGSGHL
jgi:hypothetical protein